MKFSPHTPQQYTQPVSHFQGQGSPGLLGNDGIGSFLMDLGIGAFTGNWAPLIGSAIGGGGAGDAASSVLGSGTKKNGGTEDPSELNKTDDTNNPENDVKLASEKMSPELGQTLASVQQPTSPQVMPQAQPQYFRDPMKWWSPTNA